MFSHGMVGQDTAAYLGQLNHRQAQEKVEDFFVQGEDPETSSLVEGIQKVGSQMEGTLKECTLKEGSWNVEVDIQDSLQVVADYTQGIVVGLELRMVGYSQGRHHILGRAGWVVAETDHMGYTDHTLDKAYFLVDPVWPSSH